MFAVCRSVCARLQKMCDHMAGIQKKIVNLQRRIRRAAQGENARKQRVDQQALVIFIFSNYRAEIAAHFQLSMSNCFSSLDSAVAHVEWAYINAPFEEKVALMLNPCAVHPMPLLSAAFRYLLLFQLHEWVKKMNYEFGVAPSRRMMVDRVQNLVPDSLPPALQEKLRRPLATARGQRRYLAAFRKRFGCKLGKLRTCSPMPLEEKQSKACRFLVLLIWRF